MKRLTFIALLCGVGVALADDVPVPQAVYDQLIGVITAQANALLTLHHDYDELGLKCGR